MFRPVAAAALLLASLAACGDTGTSGNAATNADTANLAQAAPAGANPYQQRLLALSEVDRSLALRRAIQDDGGSCPRADGSVYQQDYKRMAMWIVRCSSRDGRTQTDWAVYVAASGDVQPRRCSEARQLGLPQCIAAVEARRGPGAS